MASHSHELTHWTVAELSDALRKTTEALAAELDSPTPKAPEWSVFEWGIARAVVTIHGIAGLLLRQLQWGGVPGWREFLAAEVADAGQRYEDARAALVEIDSHSRLSGVAVVALKGMALHAMGLYQPGERPMADLDLLVQPAELGTAADLLEKLGFEAKGSTWKHREYSRIVADGRTLKIDLHTRLAERLAYREFELPGDVFSNRHEAGVQQYRSRLVLLRHLLLHTASNMSTHWVRGVHLHDIARLSEGMSRTEWADFSEPGWPHSWLLYPPLALVARYFPGAINESALDQLAARCPPRLARITRRHTLFDVSASNPHIFALPAMAWCTSFADLLRYVRLRAIPERSELASLRAVANSGGFAAGKSWYQKSQPARIAEWLFRRSVRPATLFAVRRVLAQEGAADAVSQSRQ
jgi:Uncharacterised nucleotidyltransferase